MKIEMVTNFFDEISLIKLGKLSYVSLIEFLERFHLFLCLSLFIDILEIEALELMGIN